MNPKLATISQVTLSAKPSFELSYPVLGSCQVFFKLRNELETPFILCEGDINIEIFALEFSHHAVEFSLKAHVLNDWFFSCHASPLCLCSVRNSGTGCAVG